LIDLVIFDNDGVLVDSEPIACTVLAGLLTELGLQTSFQDVVRDYLGGSIERTRSIAEGRLAQRLPEWFEDAFHERLFERLDAGLEPVDDVRWAIEQLDVRYCVASSGTPERMRRSLEAAGLSSLFGESMFSAADVRHGKPAPDLFLHAAEAMNVHPSAVVVVEDSPLGVEAASAAGMHCVGYASLTPPQRLAGADAGIIRSMKELPARISALQAGHSDPTA
jgi:HAD superfamily hydrolase (TIGR01509 family)